MTCEVDDKGKFFCECGMKAYRECGDMALRIPNLSTGWR
jgi:hypothetical protein